MLICQFCNKKILLGANLSAKVSGECQQFAEQCDSKKENLFILCSQCKSEDINKNALFLKTNCAEFTEINKTNNDASKLTTKCVQNALKQLNVVESTLKNCNKSPEKKFKWQTNLNVKNSSEMIDNCSSIQLNISASAVALETEPEHADKNNFNDENVTTLSEDAALLDIEAHEQTDQSTSCINDNENKAEDTKKRKYTKRYTFFYIKSVDEHTDATNSAKSDNTLRPRRVRKPPKRFDNYVQNFTKASNSTHLTRRILKSTKELFKKIAEDDKKIKFRLECSIFSHEPTKIDSAEKSALLDATPIAKQIDCQPESDIILQNDVAKSVLTLDVPEKSNTTSVATAAFNCKLCAASFTRCYSLLRHQTVHFKTVVGDMFTKEHGLILKTPKKNCDLKNYKIPKSVTITPINKEVKCKTAKSNFKVNGGCSLLKSNQTKYNNTTLDSNDISQIILHLPDRPQILKVEIMPTLDMTNIKMKVDKNSCKVKFTFF